MNKKDLYQKILSVRAASPTTFAPHGYLRDHHPKVLEQVQARFEVRIVKAEHLFSFLNPKINSKCKTCGGPTAFEDIVRGFKPYCSTSCVQNSADVRAKKEQTNLERRGVRWPAQSIEVLKKVRKTNLKRFGVEHAAQSKKCQKKARKTSRAKYGTDHPQQSKDVRDKVVATNLKNSGGLYTTPFQDPKSMAKARTTMTSRYGAAHSGQVPELFAKGQKSRFTHYDVVLEGQRFRVQGYEDMAIRLLLEWGVAAKKIHHEVHKFDYKLHGDEHAYYPDFYVEHLKQRVYVEVKSDYTAGLRGSGLDARIVRKGKAVVKAGKPFLLMVIRTKDKRSVLRGKRVGWITNFMFSTPKRPDWKLYSKKVDKQILKQRILSWIQS